MKRLTSFVFLSLIALMALAQRHVTGKVVENDSQDPVSQTTVKLLKLDSTLISGVLTDLEGRFRLKAPSAGKYIVQVTYVGFKPYTKRVTVAMTRTWH